MTRLSFRRYFDSQQFWAYIMLALLPVLLTALVAILVLIQTNIPGSDSVERLTRVHNGLYIASYIHFSLIFSAMIFGTSMMREEIDQQTFHYFLLSTMPRWLFAPAKMAGFFLFMFPLLVIGNILMRGAAHLPAGLSGLSGAYLNTAAIQSIFIETAVLGIGLLVYCSLLMTVANFIKNNIFALFFYGWEISSNIMPEVMRNFTVSYYLKDILPYKAAERTGFMGVLAEGPGALQTTLMLGGAFIICTVFTSWWVSRKECLYGSG